MSRSLLATFTLFLAASAPPASAAADEALVKKTYTYKTVDGVPIRADVYRPNDDRVRPVVVYLHGGALIVGSRVDVPKDILSLCRAEGYIVRARRITVPSACKECQPAERHGSAG